MKTLQTRSTRFGATGILASALLVIVASGSLLGVFFFGGDDGDNQSQSDLFAVSSGGFKITIPASGELAALEQVEISSKLEGRAVITEIVDEGETVKEGDILIRLNDEEAKTRIEDSENEVTTAESSLINAETGLEALQEMRDSELAKADLRIRLSELTWQEWEEGELVSKRQDLALASETAERNYERLRDYFEQSGELRRQNFISEDQYRRDEIAMIEARANLKKVRLAAEVYEKYTYEKDRATRASEVREAKDERKRTATRFEAEIRGAESEVTNWTYNLKHRRERLAKRKTQLEHCTITAPSAGLIVYISSIRTWENQPDVGTEIYRNRTVIILPDTSVMVAEVKVNEALIGQIESGQRATIHSDALPDTIMHGEIISIGVLAEGGNWNDPNRRDYTVRIRLDDTEGLGLKPAMRCRADIFVGQVEDSLYIPVQAVFHNDDIAFVYTPDGAGYAQTAVRLGQASELFVEISEGLEAGQQVLLREPGLEEITHKLPPGNEARERPRTSPHPGRDHNESRESPPGSDVNTDSEQNAYSE